MFGSGSVMVWEGISMEDHTDHHMLASGTLTAAKYRKEILRPIIRPWAFLLVQDNAWPHVARVCKQFLHDEGTDAIFWALCSPDLNSIKNLWDTGYRCI